MLRALFEKTGNAIYISHLDLMRVFQRAFKRADLHLTHTKGYNPRPSVSIAMPLSLGVESHCELLDFELEGEEIPAEEIKKRLNAALISGIKVLEIYHDMNKLKNLALLECALMLEYDHGIPLNAEKQIAELFSQDEVVVEKKGKNGVTEQNIIPMIRRMSVNRLNESELVLTALISCQNPSLNPMQLSLAITKYLPDIAPDFVRCSRLEVFDTNENVFR